MATVISGDTGVSQCQPGSATPNALAQRLTLETAKTASGTSISFAGIPAWAKRITVMFDGVSTNGAGVICVRVGAGALALTGYKFSVLQIVNTGASAGTVSSNGANLPLWYTTWSPSYDLMGHLVLTKISGNTWVCSAMCGTTQTGQATHMTGSITLASDLALLSVTTVNGTDTFDAGSVNILYE